MKNSAKKLILILMVFSIIISSMSGALTINAAESCTVTVAENGIYCEIDGEAQTSKYLFITCADDSYGVCEAYDDGCTLYYFDADGAGTAFSGIYDGYYYTDGRQAVSDEPHYIVSGGKIYEVSPNASVSVYIKDSSKTGTYRQIVDGACYSIGYSTGSVTLYTGLFGGYYYVSGALGTASAAYYKVISSKLYKIEKDASAAVYKKDTSKSGTYTKLVDGVCYNVSYKTGATTKFTGVYSGKYYKSGKPGTASSAYYKVYGGKLYKVSANASASVYKKDTKKSGTYRKIVDGVCYSVSYKTGAASLYTGIYNKKFYTSGKLTNGWQTVNKKKYYCKSGVAVKGIQKIDGKVYYFDSKGVKYTGSGWKTVSKKKYYFTKGVAKTGWAIIDRKMYHFSAKGALSKSTTIDGVKVDKNGKATGPNKKFVPLYAKVLAKSITKSSNSKEKNLRLCFDYVINTYKSNGNPRVPHYTKEDWIYVYANDMYGDRGGGNCFSYASAFAFLAKECGYEEVYGCNSGGHGWVEIDGKVYDPEQYKDVGKKIYGWEYSDSRIGNYKGAIADYDKKPWKHVKIPG